MTPLQTISQLYTDILNDLQAGFGVNISPFGKVALRVIAAYQAGKLALFYKALGLLQKNIFPDTADSESIGGTLERFGRVKLNRNPFPAVAGQYTVTVNGTVGATIKAQTTFKSNDNASSPGMLFILDNAYTLVSSPDTITIRALTGGTISSLVVGDQLTSTSPIILVNSLVTVAGQSVQPLDAETLDTYRSEVLLAFRLSPQGGAAADYQLWSYDAQGVQQVYPYAANGQTATVNLFVEAVLADSTDGKGTPGASILSAVQGVVEFNPDTSLPLDQRGRRPCTDIVQYLPVTPMNVDIVVQGFIGLTTAMQTTITNALTKQVNLIRPFVAGADILADKNDILDTNFIISVILSVLPGSQFGTITLNVNSTSVPTYTFTNGNIPWFNSVTFV